MLLGLVGGSIAGTLSRSNIRGSPRNAEGDAAPGEVGVEVVVLTIREIDKVRPASQPCEFVCVDVDIVCPGPCIHPQLYGSARKFH